MTCAFQVEAGLTGESRSPETDRIHAADAAWVSVREQKGQDVLPDGGFTSHHGITPQPHVLMDSNFAGKINMVFDHDMSGEGGVVGENTIVVAHAIVSDVNT